jgi:hypothetical protein
MRVIALVLLALITGNAEASREWRDSIRDVYIDGRLDRNAQTLTTSSPRLIAVVCGEDVLVFDPEQQTLSRMPKTNFAFNADRTVATTANDGTGDLVTTVVKPDPSTLLATMNGRSILLTSHQSKAGAMTIEELWETAPVWKAIADVYEPDGAIVDRLRAIQAPVTLQVVLATWCGDSRQHVPRLLKSIARAANPNITVELTGVGPEFEPMELVTNENITNVPTVIVRRDGREIGRFVETPAGAAIETDVADIVAGTPKRHPGRIERGALLASGTYLLRNNRRRSEGVETFELYERPGGGTIAHSMIARNDGSSVETWASIDAEKVGRFVEVTHRAGTTTRARYRRSGEEWLGHARGASGGIVDQTVYAPAAFVTPATITYGWARDAARAYVIPEIGAAGTRPVRFQVRGDAVPRYVRLEDGSERVLVNRR